MDEAYAIAKMVPPSRPRPSIWRQGVLQILITRACDKACFGCTQNSQLGGKPVMITPEEYEKALKSIKGYFGVIGMFGGNPAMHPRFEELCAILRNHFPQEQCGLWCNHPKGKAAVARQTFNPSISNLNVHQDAEAYNEFARDWPECRGVLKGMHTDSRHSPPLVSMIDVGIPPEQRWAKIADCDINKFWSAIICPVPGKGLRAFFCEIAGGMAIYHAENPDWPDTGMEVSPGWWKKPMTAFADQVRQNCHHCGIPLRRYGQLANGGEYEEVSLTHARAFKPKVKERKVALITIDNVGDKTLHRSTDYIENGSLP